MERYSPDIKYRTLIAFYIEYLRVVPDNTRITPQLIGIESFSWFFCGLRKLEIEGYIVGMPLANDGVFQEVEIDMSKITITKQGIELIESIFSIEPLCDPELKISILQIAEHAPKKFKEFVKNLCEKLEY